MRNSTRGEQRRLVAAGAGAHFEDGVALVGLVLRAAASSGSSAPDPAPAPSASQLLLGQRLHLGIGAGVRQHGARDFDLALASLQLADRSRPPASARNTPSRRARSPADRPALRGQRSRQILMALDDAVELVASSRNDPHSRFILLTIWPRRREAEQAAEKLFSGAFAVSLGGQGAQRRRWWMQQPVDQQAGRRFGIAAGLRQHLPARSRRNAAAARRWMRRRQRPARPG